MQTANVKITYNIRDMLLKEPDMKPIFTSVVYQVFTKIYGFIEKASFNTYFSRAVKCIENMRKIQRGIYYKTVITPFGEAKLDKNVLIRAKYILTDGEIIGYETGPSIMQKLGLTTQIARMNYVATNNTTVSRNEESLHLYLSKPIIEINEGNYRYLQLLDVMENKFKVAVEVENPSVIYKEFIEKNNVKLDKLIKYATLYNNDQLVLAVAKLMMEMDNAFTFTRK